MEEVRKIAIAHYKASPDNIQELARNFFRALDSDGDGKIDLQEFLALMKELGFMKDISNRRLFKKLDGDGNGTLDFWEVVTLYYAATTRPVCDRCGDLIPGPYFTCTVCLKNPEFSSSFDLCLDCYTSQESVHTHQGISHFVDNYSLSMDHTKSTIENKSPSSEAKSQPSTVKKVSQRSEEGKIALQLLDVATNSAQICATVATISGACTIS